MSGSAATDPIVDFYLGGRDHRGRTLDEILAWPDDRLESVHDYIQWTFPTRQPSAVNPFAPLVTDSTVRAFARDPRLAERLGGTFDRMLLFYGLQWDANRRIVDEPGRFASRSGVWLHPGNHNHLRLTRIMESLATLGLFDEAIALQDCLTNRIAREFGAVSKTTLEFWRKPLPAARDLRQQADLRYEREFTYEGGLMFLVRDIMYCKPGKARAMVDKFKALARLTEGRGFGKMRILTDISAERYWTVVTEMEVPSLESYAEMTRQGMQQKEFQDAMKDYHDLVEHGRREIYSVEQ